MSAVSRAPPAPRVLVVLTVLPETMVLRWVWGGSAFRGVEGGWGGSGMQLSLAETVLISH